MSYINKVFINKICNTGKIILFPIIQKINKEGEELLDISNGSDDTRELADVINLLEVKQSYIYVYVLSMTSIY